MKRNSLILSILTIVLCATLIAGSSFALFTSESKVNVAVTAGTVKVTATAGDISYTSVLGAKLEESKAVKNGNVISIDKMVPGDVINFDITIHNESDVTINYRTIFNKISGNNALFNALKISITNAAAEDVPATQALSENGAEAPAIATPYGTMLPGDSDIVLNVTIELPVETGNALQGTACKLAYTVEAVQGNTDFGGAWDGVTVDTSWYTEELATQIAAATAENPVEIEISTAAQYAGLVKISNTKTCFKNTVIKLTNDIDLERQVRGSDRCCGRSWLLQRHI